MKLIVAIVRPEKLNEVLEALFGDPRPLGKGPCGPEPQAPGR